VITFDGHVTECRHPYDVGKMVYRVTSANGIVRASQLEVTVNLETLKCVAGGGRILFEKSGLAGRIENLLNGYVELKALEITGYTPDFKFVQKHPMRLDVAHQSVQFVAPLEKIAGLPPRSSKAKGARTVIMTVFLDALAEFGDVRTAKGTEVDSIAFGAYNLLLSESKGTLTFAL
jgi:hypothetical protein